MLYTLKVNSPNGQWIGYQILAGVGAGAGVQIPFIAVQVVSSVKDMPTSNACVLFFNSLGGALSISIAQNIFVNTLAKEIPKYVPDFDPQIVAQAGATNLRQVVPPELLPGVLHGYNNAIVTAFVLAIATSCLAFLVSLGQEQKSVKGKISCTVVEGRSLPRKTYHGTLRCKFDYIAINEIMDRSLIALSIPPLTPLSPGSILPRTPDSHSRISLP